MVCRQTKTSTNRTMITSFLANTRKWLDNPATSYGHLYLSRPSYRFGFNLIRKEIGHDSV